MKSLYLRGMILSLVDLLGGGGGDVGDGASGVDVE